MRPKILTVDDSKTVRLVVQRLLAPYPCDLSEATNGYNALFQMERALPDLLLLDVNMPIMGGLELLTMMRSNPTLKAIPVIMLTSPADHTVLGELATLGVSGIVPKPFTPTALLENIRAVLSLQPATDNSSDSKKNGSGKQP
jgi:CheY-like chemotaxis protein